MVEGLSYASEIPEIERKNDRQNQVLNYLAVEAEISPVEKFALVARLHHRSGVRGLYNGAKGGSNAYLFGLRFKF